MLREEAVPRLEAEGYIVQLIEQENKGLAGAVDAGLKHFTGEFLTWPDPDDWLTPNSIKRRVEVLRENPDVAVLRTNANLFNEERQVFEGYFLPLGAQPSRPDALFEDMLFMRTFFAPVCHLVRGEMFLAVHPTRTIYFTKASSQNVQLLLPIIETYPVLQLNEPLGNYCVRDDSRSRAAKTPIDLMRRYDQLLDLSEKTVERLKAYRPEMLERVQNFHWRTRMLPVAFRGGMVERCETLLDRAALSPARKWLARILVRVRCSKSFKAVDERTRRVMSRALARTFDRVIHMPKSECRWIGAPLGGSS
jgi:glycosyltransferase involved in cell wall biosynthesis